MIAWILSLLLRLTAHLPESRFAAWAGILAAPLVAWVFAALLVGPGPGSRFRRAGIPMGVASMALLVLVALVRLVLTLDGRYPGGPIAWLMALDKSASWRPTHAVMGLGVIDGAALVLLAAVAALAEPKRGTPFRVPFADPVGGFLVLATLIGVALGDHPYRFWGFPLALDLVAVMPIATLALAIWTRSERSAAVAPKAAPPPPTTAPLAALDVAAAWRALGAIDGAQPLAVTAASAAAGAGAAWVESAWAEIGGVGPAPRALEEILATWSTANQAFLVGDLPDPTDQVFLAALVLLALRREGLTLLIVAEQPRPVHARVAAAFAKSGRWPSGELVVGGAAAREAFAAGRTPAAVFVTGAELSSEMLPVLGAGSEGSGPRWCAGLNRLLVAGADGGTPLEVTHRTFTLRRLGLALRANEARCAVVACGLGGESGRATLEAAFPGWSVREAAYGPRASAAVRVWRAAEGFREAPGLPWVRRALDPVVARQLPAAVGDPMGSLEASAAQVWGGDVRFVRADTLDGVASASAYDDAWMIAAFRALPNRAPIADGRPHDALWGLPGGGVTRFLTREGNLEGLARAGRLPSPRPLIGYANRLLQLAHLRAALAEGPQDVESLCGVFDRSLVESALGTAVPTAFALRSMPSREGLVRSPLAPRASSAANPLRTTVTDQVVRVINEQGGELLAEVDDQVAATRFYPGRVFARGERRFVVPLHRLDSARAEMRVTPVGSEQPLTVPDLRIRVEAPVQVQATQEVRAARLAYQLATFEVTAVEEVGGYRQVGRPLAVKNAPVTSRYRTRVRALVFAPSSPAALFHLARSLDDVLVSHLLAGDEDVEVFPCGSLATGLGEGVAVVDRYVQGMGAAEALDPQSVSELLRWVQAILQSCSCAHGCRECSPPEVLEAGPDKPGVLRLLGA